MSKLPELPVRKDFFPTAKDDPEYSIFLMALRNFDTLRPTAMASLESYASNSPRYFGLKGEPFRPLSFAAYVGSVGACKWLFEQGVDLHQAGLHGELGLVHDAAMGKEGNAAGVLHWLAEQLGPQCLLEETFAYGNALHVAALADNVTACAAILAIEPCAFDEVDMAGKTPLECAMRRKGDARPENAIRMLMAYQAREAAQKALSGFSPRHT